MTEGDDRIVALLGRSEPGAIELLYDRYGRLAYSLAFRVLADTGAAEDVVQESFLAVWRQAERFDSARGSLRTWLCTIVHNRALDRVRGRRGRTRLDLPMEAAPGLSVPDSWELVAEGLTRDAVRKALDQLPQEQRETVDLAYYGGFSQAEISQRMAVPLGTVKGRTRLAMRRLHQLLAGEVLEGSV